MSNRKQYTDWGSVEQLNVDQQNRSAVILTKEIIHPGQQEAEHIHYAAKQTIYILSGIGEHSVNGSVQQYHEGDTVEIPVGAVHSVRNIGEIDFVQLVANEPLQVSWEGDSADLHPGEEYFPEMDVKFVHETLSEVSEKLAEETLDHLYMTVLITDSNQIPIYHGKKAQKCMECTATVCPLKSNVYISARDYDSGLSVNCHNDLSVLIMPIQIGKQLVGYIKGGIITEKLRIFQNAPDSVDEHSTAYSFVWLFMRTLRTYIRDYFYDARIAREMNKNRMEQQEQSYTKSIISAYEQTRDIALNLQVRNHFLFNALNSIAALAINDGSIQTYKAILDLSDLFRGLLRKEGTRVPLREELDFLKKYLHLQQLRHEGSLKVIWDNSKEADDVIVPHHFLQIIVENSFVHAFQGMTGVKRIIIKTVIANQYMKVIVSDNGSGMDEDTLLKLKQSLYENNTHGLSMIFRKFSGIYGTDFVFDINSKPGRGTTYQISLPL